MTDVSHATTAEEFMKIALEHAFKQFPDHGFLLYMVDDKDGSLTMLTNVDEEEVATIHAVAESGSDVPLTPFEKHGTRH